MDKRINQHKWLATAIIIMMFAVPMVLALLNYWADDDINYQFVIGERGTPLDSIADLVRSQICHYQAWNGRVVAHILVQAFCGLVGQTMFAICHGLAFVLFAMVSVKLAGADWLSSKSLLIFFICAMFSFLVPYGPAFLIGYYWMPALILSWLLVLKGAKHLSPTKAVLLALFSICAGNAQEAYSVGIISAMGIYVMMNFKKVTPAQWLMMVSFLVGFAIIMLSPASMRRFYIQNNSAATSIHSTLLKMFYYLRMLYVMLLFVLYLIATKKISIADFVKDNLFWINVIVFTIVFTILIGCNNYRQLFAIELSSIIIILRYNNRYPIRWGVVALAFLLLIPHLYYHTKLMLHRANTLMEVGALYEKSTDGVVYYDLDGDDTLLYETFSFPLVDYGYCMDYLSDWYAHKYSTKGKLLRVYPSVLQEITGKNVTNKVMAYGEHGPWLLISSKSEPGKFILVSHAGFENIKYKQSESPYCVNWGYPMRETCDYVATWVTKSDYPYVHYDAIKVEEN